jgi:MFS family permease
VRRLLLIVGAIVLVDTMFFAAITPLLPHYRDELGLSKTSAGVLVGAYPAGTLLGALPAGWLAARWGVKPTVLLGLALLGGSSIPFGVAEDVAVLDVARFVQGLGGAASWSGGLAWLVRAAPRERRGEVIGSVIGAAIFGALLGPVLGAVANHTDPAPVFAGVTVFAAFLAFAAAREPAPANDGRSGDGPDRPGTAPGAGELLTGPLHAGWRSDSLRLGVALIVFVGLFFGAIEVLVPLRLDELGASGAVVGATFLCAAALQALASRRVGQLADRRGARAVLAPFFAAAALLAVLLPLPAAAGLVVMLVVLGAPLVGSLWVPGAALLSEGAEQAGLDQAYAFATMNFVWSGAQLAGSAGGGAAADAAGDLAVYLALAALSAAALLRTIGRPWRSPAPGS